MTAANTPPDASLRHVVTRLLRETIPASWRLYVLSLVCIVGIAGFTAALAYSTKLIINEVFVADDRSAAWRVAALVVGISAAKSLFQYANSVISFIFTRSVATGYQKKLFRTHLGFEIAHFVDQQASSQMAQIRLYGDASARVVVGSSIKMVTECLTLVALATVMVIQDPLMSLSAAVLFPLIFLIVGALSQRIRAVAQAETEMTGAYFALGTEALTGIKTVKSYGLEEKSITRFDRAVDMLQKRLLGIAQLTSATVPLMEFLGGLVIGGFVVYAAWQTQEYGKTPGEYTAFLTAFLMAYQPAERLSKEWVELQKSLVQAQRMLKLLDTPAHPRRDDGLGLEDVGSDLSFEGVSFAYGKQPALKDVSFTIPAGERVAVVGRSGAGKTTLIDLVQGFYAPQAGDITIGERNLAELRPDALRAAIALISQDVFLFEGSIRDNIRDGNSTASSAEIEEAARRAQVMDFAQNMKLGLDSPVGPNGSLLSGGQRQRVGIARALAKHAKIYIFDEATSALDGITERNLMNEVFASAGPEAVFLFVTHRASTLSYVDRVMLLERGKLLALATHDELIHANATYRTLFNLALDENA